MRRVMVWLLVGLFARSQPAAAQWQKNEYQLQREAASRYEPAPFRIAYRARSAARTAMRIRFYSDEGYRASSGVRWQDRVRAQLGQLNQLLEPAFGVRLEVESFKQWQRGGPGGALAPMLAELERLDVAADVDWVIGLVAPLPLVSMSFHDLGWATLRGRHFVVRSMSSIPELDDFNRMFKALDREQRESLYSRRKAHKELAIFLHEWAHTLGAEHASDPRRIMGERYSHESSVMTEEEAGLVAAALKSRLESRGVGSATPGPSSPPAATRPPAGDSAKPADPAFVIEAREHLRANRRSEALAVAHRAAARAGESPQGSTWVTIARLYGEIGALTHAEQALGRAATSDGAPAAAAEILRLRRSYGLPKTSAPRLPPDGEPEYVGAVLRVRALLASNQIAPAREAVQQELRRFPGTAGMLTLSCEAATLGARAREAAAGCAQALKAMEDLPRAHYLTGLMRANSGRTEDAIKSLRRAIELAPDQTSFWNALGDVYRSTGRSREFRALLADQQKAASEAAVAPTAGH